MHRRCFGRTAGSPAWAQSDGRRVSPSGLWEQNLQLLWPCRHTQKDTYSLRKLLNGPVMCGRQTPVAPLCQGEFACCAADLVLVKAGHQLSVHFDVGATVASLFIVIRSWKNGDHLHEREKWSPLNVVLIMSWSRLAWTWLQHYVLHI